jgi:hypothetical protein
MEHLPIILIMLIASKTPHASEWFSCVIDLIGDQPILCQRRLMTRKLVSDTRLHCDPDHLSQQVVLALGPKPTSFNPSVMSRWGRDFSPDRNVLSESYSITGRGKEFSYLRLTINCRVRLPHISCIVSRAEQSSLALRDQHELPLKSMLLTNLIFTCIGVMHIVDMYASRDLNQVSLSLLRTTPNITPFSKLSDLNDANHNSHNI